MLLITKIETLKTKENFAEMYRLIYTSKDPYITFGSELLETKVAKEIIKGRRFINPQNGIDVVLGASNEVGDLIGLQYEAWETQIKNYTSLQNKHHIISKELNDIKMLNFWGRIKFIFTGKISAEPKRPKVGLGVIIQKDGKILLGKRKNSHGAGEWSLPGGHLEFNESWEDCAMREVREEVGIEIGNIRFFRATNDLFPKEDKHYITLFMQADYVSGEVVNKEPDKAEDWKWFNWDTECMPSPLFTPLSNLLIQLIQNKNE